MVTKYFQSFLQLQRLPQVLGNTGFIILTVRMTFYKQTEFHRTWVRRQEHIKLESKINESGFTSERGVYPSRARLSVRRFVCTIIDELKQHCESEIPSWPLAMVRFHRTVKERHKTLCK